MPARIPIDRDKIVDFCERNRITWLALFGSVLRDDFHEGSDVDVLFEIEPGVKRGLAWFDLDAELAEILGREVDLVQPEQLSKYIRNRVLSEAETIYVRR